MKTKKSLSIKDWICPNCGGELVYDEIFEEYICPFCGARYSDIESSEN
jgi:rubredoxin